MKMPFDFQSFCKSASTEDPSFRSSYKYGEEVHKDDTPVVAPQGPVPKV